MKKIPTLFIREFFNHKVVKVTKEVTPGMEWVLTGEGDATVKWDGSCCAIIDGVFYKRYDAKKGKLPHENAIPCCEPDVVTGHWPHWVLVDENAPGDKWFVAAYKNTLQHEDGTYEAVGTHSKVNADNLSEDIMIRHGIHIVDVDRSFDGIRKYLESHSIEGLVFYKDGVPMCKIKRSDFGFKWPVSEQEIENR